MSLLIVGCGYIGQAVAKLYNQATQDRLDEPPRTIFALTRSAQRASELAFQGIQPLVGNWLIRSELPKLTIEAARIRTVLVAVPHRADTAAGLSAESAGHHAVGLSNLVEWLKRCPQLPRLVYLSTSGVFGNCAAGETVTELSPVSPSRIGPRIAVEAEQWLQKRTDWQSCILRLAGIYGPQRIPLSENLRQGQPLTSAKDGWLNLIHQLDAARAVAWLAGASNPGSLYLLSDGNPVRREDFYRFIAELNGWPEPNFCDPHKQDSAGRGSHHKIVDSTRFWKDSQLIPCFEDYRQGLREIFSTS